MAAMEPLCLLIGIDAKTLTKEENQLLEAKLYLLVCDELKKIFRQQYKHYFYLMKFKKDQEDAMLEKEFVQNILKDIISADEYDVQGIACYTDTPVDLIHDLLSGLNTNPSAILFRKIIELHQTVRRELYLAIGKKIAVQFMALK
jgi:hypothetical protein